MGVGKAAHALDGIRRRLTTVQALTGSAMGTDSINGAPAKRAVRGVARDDATLGRRWLAERRAR